MTTDKDKLQKLFQAALLDSSDEKVTLKRAFPKTAAAAAPLPFQIPVEPVAPPPVAPEPTAPAPALVQPVPNAGLDAKASAELKVLLDDQNLRLKHKRRRELLGTLAVFFALTGGGVGWFVQSPERVQACRSAIAEIRSVGDITAIVAKYQKALDKIATRSHQIDAATESMDVSANLEGEKDIYMDSEMKAMTGGEGKTVGERNRDLQQSSGDVETQGTTGAAVSNDNPSPGDANGSLSLKP